MTLKDNLYRITRTESTPDCTRYMLELLPSCPIYTAHFPGMPVTPGVCLLMLAKELLEDTLRKRLRLAEVKNAKFLSVVSPVSDKALYCVIGETAFSEDGTSVQAQVTLATTEETKAKMSFTCDIAQ